MNMWEYMDRKYMEQEGRVTELKQQLPEISSER
jgi:hypothetical protein